VTVRGTVLDAPSAANNGGLNSSLSVAVVTPPPAALTAGKRKAKAPRLSAELVPKAPELSDDIPLAAPLADGESVNVQFVFGIEKSGTYRFYINVEALP
jgi:hypothetical protein